jgi:hypothetical protein
MESFSFRAERDCALAVAFIRDNLPSSFLEDSLPGLVVGIGSLVLECIPKEGG